MATTETSPLDPHRVDQLIRNDHDYIRFLANTIRKEQDEAVKQQYVHELIRAISLHSVAEEIVVYPVLGQRIPRGETTVNHSLSEHDEVKNALYALDHMHVNQEDFDQQLENVMKPLLQHMEDEEKRLLPQLVRNCWERELVELGEKFDGIKNKLPTHPHPSAPNRPPMEKVVAFMTAPLDRAFDAMAREFPEQTGR